MTMYDVGLKKSKNHEPNQVGGNQFTWFGVTVECRYLCLPSLVASCHLSQPATSMQINSDICLVF